MGLSTSIFEALCESVTAFGGGACVPCPCIQLHEANYSFNIDFYGLILNTKGIQEMNSQDLKAMHQML